MRSLTLGGVALGLAVSSICTHVLIHTTSSSTSTSTSSSTPTSSSTSSSTSSLATTHTLLRACSTELAHTRTRLVHFKESPIICVSKILRYDGTLGQSCIPNVAAYPRYCAMTALSFSIVHSKRRSVSKILRYDGTTRSSGRLQLPHGSPNPRTPGSARGWHRGSYAMSALPNVRMLRGATIQAGVLPCPVPPSNSPHRPSSHPAARCSLLRPPACKDSLQHLYQPYFASRRWNLTVRLTGFLTRLGGCYFSCV